MPAVFLMPVVLLVCLSSCKKDEDITPPLIEITSPVENAQFAVYEGIPVVGTVYDENTLTDIRIRVLDEYMIPASPAIILHPETSVFQLNHEVLLEDILMESGSYYLHIQASDGIQATNKYIKIYINEAPKELKFFLAVTRSASTVKVYRIDSAFQSSLVITRTSDYLGSAVCNDYRNFYLCGSYSGDMSVYNVDDWQLTWDVPVTINPPFAWFTGFFMQDAYCWIGYRTGKYEKYDHYGNLKMSVNTSTNWSPLKFCLLDDKLIVEEKNPAGVEREIVVHYEFSGAVYDELFVDEPALQMLPLDEESLLYLTNDEFNQGHAYIFHVPTASIWEPPSHFPSGRISAAVKIGDDVLVAHQDGIFRFSESNYGLYNWIPLNANSLFYDDVSQVILAGQGSSLKIYSNIWPAYNLLYSIDLPDTIVAVHAVYNKD